MVDAVLIFSARNTSGVLKSLRPAVHAKETVHADETTMERATAKTLGVNTVIIGDPEWPDTSAVVKRIRRSGDRRGGKEG
jgi:bifunctional ADP-heptose synthase (sugar kinase/adenylyltransferase)